VGLYSEWSKNKGHNSDLGELANEKKKGHNSDLAHKKPGLKNEGNISDRRKLSHKQKGWPIGHPESKSQLLRFKRLQ